MVYTNNNLVNKKNNTQRGAKVSGKDVNGTELPVYPFAVDVASLPERKYLAGAYFFARFIYLMLGLVMVLCAVIVFRAYSRHIRPVFIYWDKLETRFEYANSRYGLKPDENVKTLSENEYLNEFFIRNYLTKRFGITPDTEENEQNWCDCHRQNGSNNNGANANKNDNNKKQISEMGYFDLNAQCYVCKFSDAKVYSLFLKNDYDAYVKLGEGGESRRVIIIGLKKILERTSGGEVPLSTQILDAIFKGGKGNKRRARRYLYKTDFIVEIVRNEKVIERDVLFGYLEIEEREGSPQIKKVMREDYMFNPNYEIILSDYAKEIKAFNTNNASK